MTQKKTHEQILDMVGDPEITHSVYSRRDVLKKSGMGVAALAMTGMPIGLAVLTEKAMAQGTGATAALQLAAKLEYLEAEFYRRGIVLYSTGGAAVSKFTVAEDSVVAKIAAHENLHVTYLKTLLAGSAPAQPAINGTYDFSGGGNATTNPGPFAPFGLGTLQNKLDFFKLAQLFEDFGVRAYKGQLSNLIGSSSLAPAMRIHTEEARHAAMIRILRASGSGQAAAATTSLPNPIAPWPAYNATTTSLYDSAAPGATNYAFTTGTAAASGKNQSDIATLVYGPAVPLVNSVQGTTAAPGSTGEDNVSYVSSFVRFQTTSTGTAEAFDEPMSTAAVTAFAALFGVA